MGTVDYSDPEPSTQPEAWRRRDDESAKAYRGLVTYMSLGEDRSLARVRKKLGVCQTLVERWSAQYDWVSRTRQYDDHVSELRLARLSAAREKLADEQIAIATQMFTLVKSQLRALRRKKVNAMGTARLFYVASQAIQSVFGHDQPLSNERPKIVVVRLRTNTPRDFEKERQAAAEKIQ